MEYGFKKTAQLLAEEKIFAPRFLPYATQLIPLSCICATLSNQIDNATVKDASFAPCRLLSLQTRISAAYKGLSILLMQRGGKDFMSATPIAINAYFVTPVDIHHFFPKAWCTAKNLPREKWNSVINKTPLSSTTNQYLSGDAPSLYLKRIEEKKESRRKRWTPPPFPRHPGRGDPPECLRRLHPATGHPAARHD